VAPPEEPVPPGWRGPLIRSRAHLPTPARPDTMPQNREIRVAAAMLTRTDDGKMLFVRKRGTSAFMQPGGKLEPGEEPVDALCRELREELQLCVERTSPRYLGRFSAPAANEPGHTVVADIFHLAISSPVVPASEIEEIVWRHPGAPHEPGPLHLAPLTRDYVLPLWTTQVSQCPEGREAPRSDLPCSS